MTFPSSFRLHALSRTLSLAAALFSFAGAAQAQYLWLQREGPFVEARMGELGKSSQPLADLVAPRAFLADGKDLPLTTEAERLAITVPAESAAPAAPAAPAVNGDLRVVASRVDSASGAPVLMHYQARFGRTEIKAVNDLELVPTEPNGNTFKLVWKGNTVPASQVNVDTSEGWRRVLKPAKDGTVTLGTPFPGLYLLEVTARVNGAVTVDGKKYEDVRHTATLSFEVPR